MSARKSTLLLGVTLLLIGVAGLMVSFISTSAGLQLVRLGVRVWPLGLILLGGVRIAGFVTKGIPRSPIGGALLVGVGALFLAGRFNPSLSPLALYASYWPLLLIALGGVELLRHYSARATMERLPVFTPAKVLLVLTIIGTGSIARQLTAHPNLIGNLLFAIPGTSDVQNALFGAEQRIGGEQRVLNFAPGGSLTIDNHLGRVRVRPGAGGRLVVTMDQIIRAVDQSQAQRLAAETKLNISETGDSYHISPAFKPKKIRFGPPIVADLVVEVPERADLRISNKGGQVSVEGINGNHWIKTVTGRIEVANLTGNIAVENLGKGIKVSRITGNVKAGSRFGEISIDSITGDLELEDVYHGAVRLQDIGGAVTVKGFDLKLEVFGIQGETRIEAPQSSILAKNLAERVSLKTSHKTVMVSGVGGPVTINAPHSEIDIEDLTGDLEITNSHGNVRLREIGGNLTINAQHSGITIDGVKGDAHITTSHEPITVRRFERAMTIRTRHSNIDLATDTQLLGDVDVTSSHGSIAVSLPETSSFQVEAISREGTASVAGFNGLRVFDEQITGTVGTGQPQMRLESSFGTVNLVAVPGARPSGQLAPAKGVQHPAKATPSRQLTSEQP